MLIGLQGIFKAVQTRQYIGLSALMFEESALISARLIFGRHFFFFLFVAFWILCFDIMERAHACFLAREKRTYRTRCVF